MIKSWVPTWEGFLALPAGIPEPLIAVLALICIFIAVVVPAAGMMAFVERKLRADLQARVGPNRAGPAGWFQPLADLLKLLQKQISRPTTWQGEFWLAFHTAVLYSTVALLPIGSASLLVDTDMSAFLPFWAVLVLAFGTMLLGFNQGSVAGWFGGVRVASLVLAGAFPAMVALLAAGVRSGGFKWTQLASVQSAGVFGWTVLSSPFEFLAFLSFVGSGMVILGAPPFDGPFHLSDFQGGVARHLSGRRFFLFNLGRFYGYFLWATIATVVYLGGWNLPDFVSTGLREMDAFRTLQVLETCVLVLKIGLLMLVVGWIAAVTPKPRVDQVTDFAWKVLGPVSLVSLIGSALWVMRWAGP